MKARPPVLQAVFDTAKAVMGDPKWVRIDAGEPLDHVAERIASAPPLERWGAAWTGQPFKKHHLPECESVTFDLIANSVMYCFWYGHHDVRPNGASGTLVYSLLADSYAECGNQFSTEVINRFYRKLVARRFPLLEERRRHLHEIANQPHTLSQSIVRSASCADCPSHMTDLLEVMLLKYPGYASDILLKRASLFFMVLNNRFGWFEDEIGLLPCPADYRVPAVLRDMGVLKYHEALADVIDMGAVVQKNGAPEAEIRCATILVVEKLAEMTGKTSNFIDQWLYTKRFGIKTPHHLTLTTDY